MLAAGAELDFPPLLGDGDEGGSLLGQLLELGKDDVLAFAVDHQGAVAALADPLVVGPLLARLRPLEDRALGGNDAAADRRPVGSKDVHRAHATQPLALGGARGA